MSRDNFLDEKEDSLRYFDSFNSFDKKYLPELERLGLIDLENKNDFVNLDEEIPLPVMVTAASANHVTEARGLVTRMAKSYPTWRIVFYDIGLEEMTRKWFQDACNVDFRIFNLTHYDIKIDSQHHGDYRWKPLIIALALVDFPAVMWIDTSIVWSPNKSLRSFVRDISPLRSDKIPNHYLFMSADHATLPVTNKEMYSYLKPQRGPFKENYDAAAQLLFRTKSTYKLSLKWLVLCALEPKCIAPEGSQIYCNFKLGEEKNKVFAGCHRYDQSAVNIILSPYSTSYALYGAAGYFKKMGGLNDEEVPVLCYNSTKKIFINNA